MKRNNIILSTHIDIENWILIFINVQRVPCSTKMLNVYPVLGSFQRCPRPHYFCTFRGYITWFPSREIRWDMLISLLWLLDCGILLNCISHHPEVIFSKPISTGKLSHKTSIPRPVYVTKTKYIIALISSSCNARNLQASVN